VKRKPETISFWVGRLPHWEVEEGRYFITMRIAGALPRVAQQEIRAKSLELASFRNSKSLDWLVKQRAMFVAMEKWLDNANTNLWLTKPTVAAMIVEAIQTREDRGDWKVHEFVIMGNHIHLFCEFRAKGMKRVMEDFKRWTGHRAAELISIGDRFWQREWFDHWSRSDREDDRIINYIRNNPVKAGLVKQWQDWDWTGTSLLPEGTKQDLPLDQEGFPLGKQDIPLGKRDVRSNQND
jgi:REP element-mobilizing transposase RayT